MTEGTYTSLNDGRSYTLTREVHAPVADVWQFWTSPDHLKHWFGPKGFDVLDVTVDLRENGNWSTRMRAADGTVYTTHGVYTELTAPSRLVMTQKWEGAAEHSEITISLNSKGSVTELVFEHRQLGSTESRDSHAEGWTEALDKLGRYERGQA